MVTLVTDKLNSQWLLWYGMHNVTREAAAQLILQPQYTADSQIVWERVITNALQSCSNFMLLVQAGDESSEMM